MTKIKTALFICAASFALSATPVLAQGSEIIRVFTRADLETALKANNATFEASTSNDSLNVTFSNNLYANVLLLACDDAEAQTNCHGTSLLATFGSPDDASAQEIAEAISKYNYRQNFGRAYVDPDGRISVRMYIISDGGITRENYRRQIQLWTRSIEKFAGYFADEE
ncbi:YbjN domain-containing protein [Qipengyuania sp. 1XM1-15A]|uniref:YbjN domain-containing protein n=1 Tax=Qipengyuania xiamenensis TaxID=2867237 RepID=UPI001C87263E|nr:YbjN domain-containing protein [Qipengyuania xiamenensis]MBX7532910.1 YbjN domain-containing protein [Qipengyuania xiamenensis]